MQASSLKYSGYQIGYFVWGKMPQSPTLYRQVYIHAMCYSDMAKPPIYHLLLLHNYAYTTCFFAFLPFHHSMHQKYFTCNIHAAGLIFWIAFLLLGVTLGGVLAGLIYLPDYFGPIVFKYL